MVPRAAYLQRLQPFMDTDLVKVLTGIRRAGKSVLLAQIADDLRARGVPDDHVITVSFEDSRHAALRSAAALEGFVVDRLAAGRTYLLFDEIQEVSGWERCVNSLRAAHDVDIVITGSNSRLLSGELSTYLSGRYVAQVVYPFSFAEYTAARPAGPSRDLFLRYLDQGGLPFAVKHDLAGTDLRQYLGDLFRSVVLRDIVQRHEVRQADQLERVIAYALAETGHTLSASGISKHFKSEHRAVATETVLNYLSYCGEAYLLYRAPIHDLKGKKTLTVNEKFYCADHTLPAAAGQGPDIAMTLENIVYLELRRRGFDVTVGRLPGAEVDFVATLGTERLYIQVSYLMPDEATRGREFGAFRGLADAYPRLVLSLDEVDLSRDGIRHHYLPDFLLDPSW
jgi:predicted AAA+ superfamily ATPase